MSDELRKRAEEIARENGWGGNIDFVTICMLDFAAEQVAAETARCAKVCINVGADWKAVLAMDKAHAAYYLAKVIEKGE